MKDEVVDRAHSLYKDEIILPDIIKTSIIKKLMGENFKQISTEAYAYINCLLYATVEDIARKTIHKHSMVKRLQPEHIKDAVSGDDTLILNVGTIHVNPELTIDNIVKEVIRTLAIKGTTEESSIDYGKLLEGEDLSELGEETNE